METLQMFASHNKNVTFAEGAETTGDVVPDSRSAYLLMSFVTTQILPN